MTDGVDFCGYVRDTSDLLDERGQKYGLFKDGGESVASFEVYHRCARGHISWAR